MFVDSTVKKLSLTNEKYVTFILARLLHFQWHFSRISPFLTDRVKTLFLQHLTNTSSWNFYQLLIRGWQYLQNIQVYLPTLGTFSPSRSHILTLVTAVTGVDGDKKKVIVDWEMMYSMFQSGAISSCWSLWCHSRIHSEDSLTCEWVSV